MGLDNGSVPPPIGEVRSALTFGEYAASYLTDRVLRPKTVRNYESLLQTRLLPAFAEQPLGEINLTRIKAWRAGLEPELEASNAAAYRLLRSILQAAVEEELLERAPPPIRGASNAPVRRTAVPASYAELATIAEQMPERLRLFIVIAAFVGLRQGELLELRRFDCVVGAGQIQVRRKIDKDPNPTALGACPDCGRVISRPKTRSGVRTVHLPPPFIPLLEEHLVSHAAPGPRGLLFPGERTDHMSVRFLMKHYRPAREAAGRPDLTIHHLRHTALTIAGQHGATAAELQMRAGHASQTAMAIYQHANLERDRALAEKIGASYLEWLGGLVAER
ncbi:MAG TPA: tyrosine-type recombinase/integrase [Marmoricola sp.]|nr:tyrosine-type recombinase/integrase [Marmoricola sp.]